MTDSDDDDTFFGLDAASEGDSDRDGALSYSGEWHALGVGFLAGVVGTQAGDWSFLAYVAAVAMGAREARQGHVKDAAKEVAYTAAGVTLALGVANADAVLDGATGLL